MRSLLRCLRPAVLGFVLLSCYPESATAPDSFDLKPSFGVSTWAGSIVITEIMADPSAVLDAAGEWFEVYNAGTVDVNLQGFRIASANDAVHTISGNAVVPAGTYAVIARNGNTAANGGVVAVYAYSTAPVPNLNNSNNDWLALRDASGATGESVDSVFWGVNQTAGASRGVVDILADNSNMGVNWAVQTPTFGAGDRGTPGAANVGNPPPPPPPPVGPIVINEVLANPLAVLDEHGEWFEVHNRTTAAIDLVNWVIRSNNDAPHTIATSVVVPAGGFALLGRNDESSTNGGVTLDYSYASVTTLNLSNTSDFIALTNGAGATIDSVVWGASPPNGATRALTDASSNNTDVLASAWFTSTGLFGDGDKGTPGLANSTFVPGEPGVPAAISISINSPARVPVGYTKPAFPTVRDGVGAIMSPPPELTWSSSNDNVATVDQRGYITGIATGSTIIRATTGTVTGQASFSVIPATAPTAAVYRNHVEFGVPRDADNSDDFILDKPQFVSSFNKNRGNPNWVSWNLNATQFGAAPRCDCFTMDLSLPLSFYRPVDFDYRNGGYDRGHMVQSESRTTTDQENASTFLLTNILPQAANNNQGPWLRLENHLNDLARIDGKEIYIVAGGEYPAEPATLKNEGKIDIPTFTWKVAVIMDAGEGLADVRSTRDVSVIAVRMPNDLAGAALIRGDAWDDVDFDTSVDAIEKATGYDLLAALPDDIEALVESEIASLQGGIENLSDALEKGNVDAMASLVAKAAASIARGNTIPAANQLEAFINQVEAAMTSGRLSRERGAPLIQEANTIIRNLE